MQRPYIGLECPFLDSMLILKLLESDFDIFSEFALLVLVDEQNVFDSISITNGVLLLVEIERHDVVLFEVLNFPLLVDQLALLVL